MDTNIIYKKAEDFVTDLFEKHPDAKLLFHNLQHTETVVERTKEIAAHYNLSDNDMLVLYVAAWFHDSGHLYTPGFKNHEERSVEVMNKFMSGFNNEKELVSDIETCILSTKMPRNPATLLQEIICDADTYHLGTKDFKITNQNCHAEFNLREKNVSDQQWDEGTLQMLNEHRFYTSYCKDLLDGKKKKNIKKIKNKLKETGAEKDDLRINEANSLTTKGIQTMLRLTSENHLKLSDMADHKANILISVNAIIISIILGVLMRKLEEEPALTIPTIIFLLVAVTTIVIAILATRPKVSSGTFTEQDIVEKKTNLLFFGNFYKAPLEQYDRAMRQMMKDPDYLYGSLIKDIYMLSVVLGRKYKLIRLAYYIFMIGIIVSVAAFAIAALFYNNAQTATGASPSAFPL